MPELEFGSDFHYVINIPQGENIYSNQDKYLLFANGRQSINQLISFNNWKRIWVPEYFCYDVIESIKSNQIEIEYYPDYPLANDIDIINNISFREKDVIIRMNYFGLREWRDNSQIPIPVIEDHSHDLIGSWVNKSNANWCISSLRKTIPISEGGALWTTIESPLPYKPSWSLENELFSLKRLTAMVQKSLYINGEKIEKDTFRKLFIETEKSFDNLPVSKISNESLSVLKLIDLYEWYQLKRRNWMYLYDSLKYKFQILEPESNNCFPFSLIILLDNEKERNKFREELIKKNIYPAILWAIPRQQTDITKNFSNRVISLHCDGRYALNEIEILAQTIINL